MDLSELITSGAETVMLVVKASDLKKAVERICDDRDRKAAEERAKARDNPTLTRQDAAALLGVSLATLARWAKEGYIKPVKIGTLVRYRQSDIDRILENRKKK